jgi:hypothetical protein
MVAFIRPEEMLGREPLAEADLGDAVDGDRDTDESQAERDRPEQPAGWASGTASPNNPQAVRTPASKFDACRASTHQRQRQRTDLAADLTDYVGNEQLPEAVLL